MDHQLEIPVEAFHHSVGGWVPRCGLLANDAPLSEPFGPFVGIVWGSSITPQFVRASVRPVGLREGFLQLRELGGPQDVYHRVSGVQVHLCV